MFGFFLSESSKMRRDASNWLEVADRVYHYRRDLLSAVQCGDLQTAKANLKQLVKDKAASNLLKPAIEKLEAVLARTGGRLYPANSITENVEFFLVAAIVILGLRAYFFQPFKIPTNSMWPTYYGMTHEVFNTGEEPGPLARAARLLAFGATRYDVVAPADGEIMIPVTHFGGGGRLPFSDVAGRTLAVFPAVRREFFLSVGGEYIRVNVPADFDFERVLEDKYAGPAGDFGAYLRQQVAQTDGKLNSSILRLNYGGRQGDVRVYWVPTGLQVKKGEKLFSFDILTGDLLFVDRITYNFFPPKVGQGFVFKTDNIDSPEMKDFSGRQIQQYYIKRLVGTPGDTLQIQAPALLRNGQPIDGSAAFGHNARKEGLYPGYVNFGELGKGLTLTIPAHSYYALGDNSPRSKDSRYWGFVPEKDIVGRPLFIYYPFTKRWGPAR